MSTIQELISQGVPIIYDGAMGTEIQKLGFGAEDAAGHPQCNEIFNLTKPDAISELHARYFEAGATIVETNTIGGNRVKLTHFGFGDQAYEVNRAAAQAARKAVNCIGRSCFVCGAMGPTGLVPATDSAAMSFGELVAVYEEQSRGLLDGGVDLLLLETAQLLLELRAAVTGVRQAMRAAGRAVPLQVQGTFDSHGRMLLGSDLSAFLGAVAGLGPDIIGLNCSTGPDEMRPHVQQLASRVVQPLAMQPNAGMPRNVGGEAVYSMSPDEFASKMAPMVNDVGVSVVGGCCGTTPDHIRALVAALRGTTVGRRSRPARSCFVGSGISGADLETVAAPVIVGERLNAQGSRKTKELLLAQNWEDLHQLALSQIDSGATVLDLCVAVNERDSEADDMARLVSYLSERVSAPFCIDTTEPSVLERALAVCPGSVLVNSINLEHDSRKARDILALASRYGCPVIGLTIDDSGMARTADRKLALAVRLRDLACGEHGLPEHYLYIDPLVFTLATGERDSADAARESLEAVRRIGSELPNVRTIMGVSNVSFGLQPAARRVLNNLMLHHAVAAGLKAAIFNPAHHDDISGYDGTVRELADDLLLNRRDDALVRFVSHFEQLKAAAASSPSPRSAPQALPPEEQLRRAVLDRDARGLQGLIKQLLQTWEPAGILNEILLPAMAEVGERMAAGKMILPFVLQAAEVMKEAVEILEPMLADQHESGRGTIVLATVNGDVHDIGKNLVGSILRNQGFRIVDLGKQVRTEDIVAAVKAENPAAVGLSALLVTTSKEMAAVVRLLDSEGLSVPVFVGGAAVNRAFAERISLLEENRRYAGGVYYAKDAFDAVRTLERLKTDTVGTPEQGDGDEQSPDDGKREPVRPGAEPVTHGGRLEPPFYGTGQMLTWDTPLLLDALRRDQLYKGYWRGGSLTGEKYEQAVRDEFEPSFAKLRDLILTEELVDARGYYSFFPAITEDEDIVILDPGDFHSELATFHFPRMARRGGRSLADWLRPEGDILAVQVVTLGWALSKRVTGLFEKEGNYTLGFYLNGIGSFLTEDLAERVTREIRRALAIRANQGRRYAFGYPGLPGVEENRRLLEIVGAEERLGIQLTSGSQMVPEHSTVTIFVHHRDAAYL